MMAVKEQRKTSPSSTRGAPRGHVFALLAFKVSHVILRLPRKWRQLGRARPGPQ